MTKSYLQEAQIVTSTYLKNNKANTLYWIQVRTDQRNIHKAHKSKQLLHDFKIAQWSGQ